MNSVARIVLALGLAGLAGGAIYLLSPERVPEAQKVRDADAQQVGEPKPLVGVRAERRPAEVSDGQQRKLAVEDLKQGVSGRVLAPGGLPCAEAEVFVLPGASTNAIDNFLRKKRGEVIPPVAAGRTGPDGTFRLGCVAGETLCDLCVVSDEWPELYWRSFKVRAEEWVETGDLMLQAGAVVQGQVVQEGSLAAVAGAQVYLQGTNAMHSLVAAPGREKGALAVTDAGGFFRYRNAPRDTSITLAAEAPGFARVEKVNVVLQPAGVNEFRLELPVGLAIAGVVHDLNGAPVFGAQVTAMAISSKLPQQGQANTDRDGHFELPGLREGPFQLAVAAAMYQEKQERPVFAGTTDVNIVLEQRGMARVRVLARNGSPIKEFTLALKRSFPNNPVGIGNVLEFSNLHITLRDFDGDTALVKGIPNGEYMFQIAAANHARTLSPAFPVLAGGEVPVVTVQMTLGGVIKGRVLDDRGAPVASATVATEMNGAFAADSEFLRILGQFAPDRVTKTTVRTAGDGAFRLPLLAYGEYMLRVSHSDFCEGIAADLKVETDTDIDVGDLTLARGASVSGTCTVGGRPAGQVKVQIGPPEGTAPELLPDGRPKPVFMASAVSDGDGGYRFSKRVPPGTYRMSASEEAGGENIFVRIVQMKQTQCELVVRPGQQESHQDFNIIPQ